MPFYSFKQQICFAKSKCTIELHSQMSCHPTQLSPWCETPARWWLTYTQVIRPLAHLHHSTPDPTQQESRPQGNESTWHRIGVTRIYLRKTVSWSLEHLALFQLLRKSDTAQFGRYILQLSTKICSRGLTDLKGWAENLQPWTFSVCTLSCIVWFGIHSPFFPLQ